MGRCPADRPGLAGVINDLGGGGVVLVVAPQPAEGGGVDDVFLRLLDHLHREAGGGVGAEADDLVVEILSGVDRHR